MAPQKWIRPRRPVRTGSVFIAASKSKAARSRSCMRARSARELTVLAPYTSSIRVFPQSASSPYQRRRRFSSGRVRGRPVPIGARIRGVYHCQSIRLRWRRPEAGHGVGWRMKRAPQALPHGGGGTICRCLWTLVIASTSWTREAGAEFVSVLHRRCLTAAVVHSNAALVSGQRMKRNDTPRTSQRRNASA
jgi:hypothetical protein